jgi:hypothetical protein
MELGRRTAHCTCKFLAHIMRTLASANALGQASPRLRVALRAKLQRRGDAHKFVSQATVFTERRRRTLLIFTLGCQVVNAHQRYKSSDIAERVAREKLGPAGHGRGPASTLMNGGAWCVMIRSFFPHSEVNACSNEATSSRANQSRATPSTCALRAPCIAPAEGPSCLSIFYTL